MFNCTLCQYTSWIRVALIDIMSTHNEHHLYILYIAVVASFRAVFEYVVIFMADRVTVLFTTERKDNMFGFIKLQRVHVNGLIQG
jgi:hypothetical protein